jgi:hypothetical protein
MNKAQEPADVQRDEAAERALLERAAFAAGLAVESWIARGVAWVYPREAPANEDGEFPIFKWAPMDDDGDALRLAVDLGIAVIPYPIYARPKHSVIAKEYKHARYLRGECEDVDIQEIQVYGDDPRAATRRAITRAAAAMAVGAA